jgi:cold shock CspA family protein
MDDNRPFFIETKKGYPLTQGRSVIVRSGSRAYDEIVPPRYVIATVREWRDEEGGWGVLSADEIPEGIWAHFSHIAEDPTVFRSLAPGERVEVDVEDMSPGDQDGFRYRARSAAPLVGATAFVPPRAGRFRS